MKVLKKVLLGILVFILIDIIFLLALSFTLKKVLINGVIKETIVERVFPTGYSEGSNIITEEQIKEITDDPRVQEMLNSPEIQQLLEKYLDSTVEGLIDPDNIDEVALEEDMLNFLTENKSVIEEKVGKEISDEMISKAVSEVDSKDLSKAYKQSIKNASKNMTTTERQVLKGYKLIISLKFRIILFICMFVDLLLIALVQKSFYKWIKTLSKSMIVSGIGVVLASLISSTIIKRLSNMTNFNSDSLTILGIIITISGIVILIIYKIVLKLLKKDDDENEIPEFSPEK